MSKLVIVFAAVVLVTLGCGLVEGDPTLSPTRTPRPTTTPTPTATPKPTPTRTPRPTFALFPGSGATSGVAANTVSEARNLVWVYLSRCASFDPVDLDAYKVGNLWYVKADDGARQQYGIWKVDSLSGSLTPHDALAAEWEAMLAADCSSVDRARLVRPTLTPTPQVLIRTNSDAVNVLWSYLVKCFPTLSTSDLEATLDPSTGAYIVKDKGLSVYGVWQVNRADGGVRPNNDRARSRDQTVKRGAC